MDPGFHGDDRGDRVSAGSTGRHRGDREDKGMDGCKRLQIIIWSDAP